MRILELAVSILVSVIMSGGFWTYWQSRQAKRDHRLDTCILHSMMLMGLGHDRIVYLGLCYIDRGWITQAEYENLVTYLYEPYLVLGGNGTVEKIIAEVKKLPIHPIFIKSESDDGKKS